jgi:Tfp pilus assembly protein PilX
MPIVPRHTAKPRAAARTTERQNQGGAATLIVTLALSVAMLLVAVYVNRNLVFEQRAASNQARATQAFEAAEAGLEWAQAQLNAGGRVGADCRPSSDASDSSFRERFLRFEASTAAFTPVTWLQGSVPAVPVVREAACVRSAAGWSCSCPLSGQHTLVADNDAASAPAFRIQFQASGAAGVVRLLATGCSRLGGACSAAGASTTATEAVAHVEVALGLVPGLKTAPAAALTARGSVDAGGAALGAHHGDSASGGIALHAGGAITAPMARIEGPAGSVADEAVLANDSRLASLDPQAFFVAYFGMRAADWQAQSVVTTLRCDDACGDPLQAAIEPGVINPLAHVQGDLRLDGPLVLGTPQRPVLIVVDGAAQLRGAVVIHGLLYARTLRWDDTAGAAALVRGAALSEGGYSGNGTPDFVYDAEVLARLKGHTGSFARINGSWRDF